MLCIHWFNNFSAYYLSHFLMCIIRSRKCYIWSLNVGVIIWPMGLNEEILATIFVYKDALIHFLLGRRTGTLTPLNVDSVSLDHFFKSNTFPPLFQSLIFHIIFFNFLFFFFSCVYFNVYVHGGFRPQEIC